MEGIADLIRQGRTVQVVDHLTGEDLTAVTLTQIIFEQEKKQAGFLPQAVLTGLVQAGGNTLSALRHSLTAPLDLLHHFDNEIERRIQVLISRGELAEDQARFLRDQLLAVSPPLSETAWSAEQFLHKVLVDRGVLTHTDLQRLEIQIATLAAKISEIPSTTSHQD